MTFISASVRLRTTHCCYSSSPITTDKRNLEAEIEKLKSLNSQLKAELTRFKKFLDKNPCKYYSVTNRS